MSACRLQISIYAGHVFALQILNCQLVRSTLPQLTLLLHVCVCVCVCVCACAQDKSTGQSKGSGIVEFDNPMNAQRAISELSNSVSLAGNSCKCVQN